MRKLPLIVAFGYLLIVLVSIIPVFAGKDALDGIFAVILTAPWPMLLGKLFPLEGLSGGLILIIAGAAINAILLYLLTRWLSGKFSKK